MNPTTKDNRWKVSKYAYWDIVENKWLSPSGLGELPVTLLLEIQGAQLQLVNKTHKAVLETLSLARTPNSVDVHLRDACMAFVAKIGEDYRKFRILFELSQDAENCADILKNYFNTTVDKRAVAGATSQGHALPKMLERIAIDANQNLTASNVIPDCFPLESAVRLCFLDPNFAHLVEKIEVILHKYK